MGLVEQRHLLQSARVESLSELPEKRSEHFARCGLPTMPSDEKNSRIPRT
jgi:hypothetical protein